MEYRTLEVKLGSAKDLKDLNLLSKMDVYAVATVSGAQKTKTPVHRNAGTNPTWNFPMKFTLHESPARLTLEINLRCERTLASDKDIGEVLVPLHQLLSQPGDGKSFQHVSYQVRKPSGKPKGALNFSYKFTAHPPVGPTSSPAPPQYQYATAYVYPPPPPPQPSYGYGYAPQPGYGYPPPPSQKPSKHNFGMGLGAGLLGGALGGLLIGDMVSDVGSYHAGFGDAAGFDF
ncbi:hypothetical protein VNO78_22689 [Psophocarpus tetragonolobus]|uniref:C2 domain-containing protein n=1 Tax=Psophocarpus tetragonolobus TaxID=3891 RepID=A0AAN9S2R8_PSOTE